MSRKRLVRMQLLQIRLPWSSLQGMPALHFTKMFFSCSEKDKNSLFSDIFVHTDMMGY